MSIEATQVNPAATEIKLAVTTNSGEPGIRKAALALAQELHLAFLETHEVSRADLLLIYGPERLSLHDQRKRPATKLSLDWAKLAQRYSRASRRELLARAVGRQARTVVDATAGLAHDALLLACLGYQVLALERCQPIFVLVREGLQRVRAQGQWHSLPLEIANADARSVLPTLTPAPDVIYLDPMFPPRRKKTAAVRKEMVLLRALAGTDPDAAELLTLSRGCAKQRVVVKRLDDAPPLAPKPHASYSGKTIRYDVYLPHA